MIPPLTRVSWTNLRRDRAAQVMVFVLPIAFFSIFALIFGGTNGGSTRRLELLVADESQTDASAALVRALSADSSLHVRTTWPGAERGASPRGLTAAVAESLVRAGEAPVAFVLPGGIDTSLARFDGRGVRVRMLVDPSDPVAPRMAAGLLQRATLEATRSAADEFRGHASTAGPSTDDLMPARIEEHEVVGRKRDNGMVSFYAAGIAVMFLMFSAAAAGGVLIEETESGTLERVLSSGVGMTRLLGSKWLYIASLGVVQITVMFVWGMMVFRLPLLPHLPGFALMTVLTAACTASFGLVLATAARTRQQLQGLANIVVLSLSAVGGSMFPRMFMPAYLQKISYVGFNAWALEGYIKVFWREATLVALWPQVVALLAFSAAFFALARRFAKRWEAA
ncbi:MAG TPA: ABC transporter permease [Candidatus Acidoferrales bacterium]|nr:ABC transporter permease [Candidatus Acidoferrales bacterium]